MKSHLKSIIMIAALAASSALAQMGPFGGAGNIAMNPTMAKLFGNNTAASAKAQVTINDSAHGQNMEMAMNMSMLDGKARMEMDMSQIKGGRMPPNAAAQMKKMGMDKMVIVSLPEKKLSLMMYPSLHAYAEMSTENAQVPNQADKNTKIDKTSLGKETIDGHDCEKFKVLITTDQGAHHEATVWSATDLKDFPVQVQMAESGNDITIKFRDVKLEKPDASLFDAPSDFTKYESPQALMQGEMMKKAGAFGR
jgi:hypothetical protein